MARPATYTSSDLGCLPARGSSPPQSHSSHGARLLGCWAISTPQTHQSEVKAALGEWRWGGRKFPGHLRFSVQGEDSGSLRALVCPQTMKKESKMTYMGRAPAASAIQLWVGRHLSVREQESE